jgi:DNA (cytosine-5)-methyltransferase 1
MVRIVKGVRPGFAIFENVARLLSGPKEAPGLWFWEFLNSLAEIGYNAEWFCITAASVGAPHERDRVWIVAYPNEAQFERGGISRRVYEEHANIGDPRWGQDKPGVVRALDGVPCQMDRLAALGNAVVPQIPQLIGNAILASLKERQVAEAGA